MKFRKHDREERLTACWFWVLLFGPLYFAKWDLWRAAGLAFVVAMMTGGISWVFMPAFASNLVEWEYERKGWERIE